MNNKKTKILVLSGLFAALCCVGTLIYVPSPTTNGYINLGDSVVILSGFVLGPLWGALAGGIGSMVTDLILGYAIYAPATLIIKGLVAAVSSIIFRYLSKKLSSCPIKSLIAAIPAEIVMMVGYLFYEAYFLGYGLAALAGLPGNIFQGTINIVVAIILSKFIKKI